MTHKSAWSIASQECADAFCEAARESDTLDELLSKLNERFFSQNTPTREITTHLVARAISSTKFSRLARLSAREEAGELLEKFKDKKESPQKKGPSDPKRYVPT